MKKVICVVVIVVMLPYGSVMPDGQSLFRVKSGCEAMEISRIILRNPVGLDGTRFQQAAEMLRKGTYKLEGDFLELTECNAIPFNISGQDEKDIKRIISEIWEGRDAWKDMDTEAIYNGFILPVMKAFWVRKPLRLTHREQDFDPKERRWSEKTVYIESYGDQFLTRKGGMHRLEILSSFLHELLPPDIFPDMRIYLPPIFKSPDRDGHYDVSDPFKTDDKIGRWENLDAIAKDYKIMLDFVFNHMSIDSEWFKKFLADDPELKDVFISWNEEDSAKMAELKEIREKHRSKIYRARTHDPFVRVKKTNGKYTWVYMTFSKHQADLNYRNPKVFAMMLQVYLHNILRGVHENRFDAIPYLWKEWGTACMHHPKTAKLLELFRAISRVVSPTSEILTESMEPTRDSAQYILPERAHKMHNFILPALIPYTILSGDASNLQNAIDLFGINASDETTHVLIAGNGHDGGSFQGARESRLSPGDGPLLTEDALNMMATQFTDAGFADLERRSKLNPKDRNYVPPGFKARFENKFRRPMQFSNYKIIQNSSGIGEEQRIIYETVSTYASLFKGDAKKIVASLRLALPLKGIPSYYLISILAAVNDYRFFLQTGNPRALNRGRLYIEDIMDALRDPDFLTYKVFNEMRSSILIRTRIRAFHPNASQRSIDTGNKAIFSLLRESQDPGRKENVIALHNVSDGTQRVEINLKTVGLDAEVFHDLLSAGKKYTVDKNGILQLEIGGLEALWLKAEEKNMGSIHNYKGNKRRLGESI